MKPFARINLSSVLSFVALAKRDALRMGILVSSLALAAAGYDDTVKKAESIGIIGGEDGPTAVWILDDKVWWLDPKPIVFKTLVANPCSSPADAARMAERIFVDIYGKGVLSERPWRVTDTNGCYFVCGTLPDGFLGGVAQLKLEKADEIGRASCRERV